MPSGRFAKNCALWYKYLIAERGQRIRGRSLSSHPSFFLLLCQVEPRANPQEGGMPRI
jgi:hypothetical protein